MDFGTANHNASGWISSRAASYAWALVVSGLAFLVRWGLDPYIGDSLPYIMCFAALMVTAGWLGMGPGIVAMLVNYGWATWFFLSPRHDMMSGGMEFLVGAVAYFGLCWFILTFSERMRRGRALAEEALRALEEQRRLAEEWGRQLEATFENAAVGIAEVELNGRWRRVNQKLCDIVGYNREEMLDKTFQQITLEDDLHQDLMLMEQLLWGRIPSYSIRKRYRHKNGHLVWANLTAGLMRNREGKPEYFVSVVQDITEQQRTEEALVESEQTLRTVFDSVYDGIVLHETDGRIIDVNQRFLELYGVQSGQETHLTVEALSGTGMSIEEVRRRWAKVIAGEPQLFDWTGRRPGDGGEFPIEVHLQKVRVKGRDVILGSVRDMTERKAAETALRESAARFTTMANNISQLAWMADETGAIFWYNQRWYDYTGTTEEQMLGWGWQKVQHPEHVQRVTEKFRRHIQSGDVWEDTFPLRDRDGEFRWFLTRAVPIRDEHGKVLRWFGTNTDVTKLRETQRALEDANEQAERANQAKDQFLAMLSHELRTPLTPVLMMAGVLEGDRSLPEDVREDMASIRRNVELETRLIDDLLDLTRVARGKLTLHKQVVDVEIKLRAALDICQGDLDKKAIQVRYELQADHTHVMGDPGRLQQIFWNLLKNSGKFTPEGGQITLRTSNPADKTIRVEVRDNGVGIEPGQMDKLFNAFEQGSPSVTKRFGGLGLGLTICKALVEMHGGTIGVESGGKDQGAMFWVELPTVPAMAKQQGDGQQNHKTLTGNGLTRKMRVLYVEDHESTGRVVTRLLRGMGHEVDWAKDLQSARRMAEECLFDLVISDVGLPDGSGLDVMPWVRKHCGDVAGIALSGYGMEEDVKRSMAAGFKEHLTKPIDIGVMMEAMQRVLGNDKNDER